MVVGNVLACGEDQGQGKDGMNSLVLKAKTLFVIRVILMSVAKYNVL